MAIELTPELGVEVPPDENYVDLRARAEAACNSINLLEKNGLQMNIDDFTAQDIAGELARTYAEDPAAASKKLSHERASMLAPASLVHLRTYLTEFGRAVVQQSVEIRHLVTNRLLEESQNADPRIRIRALELLGRISDVGLFTDRSEVTITHQTTDDLRQKLREKLLKLSKDITDEAEVVDAEEVDESEDEEDVEEVELVEADDAERTEPD